MLLFLKPVDPMYETKRMVGRWLVLESLVDNLVGRLGGIRREVGRWVGSLGR